MARMSKKRINEKIERLAKLTKKMNVLESEINQITNELRPHMDRDSGGNYRGITTEYWRLGTLYRWVGREYLLISKYVRGAPTSGSYPRNGHKHSPDSILYGK